MPGNGTIGGGSSCLLRFKINGKPLDGDDTQMPKKFKVEVVFPNGTVVTDEVDETRKIEIFWPPHPGRG